MATPVPTAPAYPEDNAVFPTPWHYDTGSVADDWMTVDITDHSGFTFAHFEGDRDAGAAFLRSARAMEASHVLLAAARAAFAEYEAMRRGGVFGPEEGRDGVAHANAPAAWHLLRVALARADALPA